MQRGDGPGRVEVVLQRHQQLVAGPSAVDFQVAVGTQGAIEPVELGLGLGDLVPGHVDGLAVVAREQGEADGLAAMAFLQKLAHGEEVAEGLRHLLAANDDVAVVHPEAREPAVGAAARLGDLVLVVRKDQVLAAAVDVEGLAQVLGAHGRALDVPARPAAPPGAVPARLGLVRGLPQHEVGRVLLVGRHVDPGAGDHLLAVPMGEAAVVGVGGHVEQHVAVGGVGVTTGDQLLDEGDHLRDRLGGARLHARRQGAEGRHVVVEGLGGAGRQRLDRLAVFPAPR